MHANHTATADLVLEQLPSGDHAWLRPAAATQLDRYRLNPDRVVIVDQAPDEPEPEPERTPRAQLPQFIVQTQTVYLVSGAPAAGRAMQWFADKSDIELDVETLDFGMVEVLGQVRADGEPEDARYVLTDQGRRALAEARQEEQARLIGPFDLKRSVAAKQSTCAACGQPQSTPDCERREHWGVA
jgi:hypothetical protein